MARSLAATASMVPTPSGLSITQAALPSPTDQPHLIKTVTMELQVDDVAEQYQTVLQLTRDSGGFLSEMSENTHPVSGTRLELTLRVPSAQLEDTLEKLAALGAVLRRNLNTRDVSLEFVDTESRIRNLTATESRLLAHLERSGEMDAILKVEKEIDRVRAELETYQGRLNNLSNQIQYATVHVYMYAKPGAGPIQTASAYSTSQTFTDATRNLLAFARAIWIVVIWLVVWCPVWIPAVWVARIVYRRTNPTTEA